jgi:hypothetical protein
MKTHDITADGKSMRYTLIVSTTVPGREVCKFLICFFTHGLWEHLIVLAAIDQERSLALLNVDLLGKYSGGIRGCLKMAHVQIFGLEKGRMSNDGRANDIFECEVERKAGYMEQKWGEYRALPAQPQIGAVPP